MKKPKFGPLVVTHVSDWLRELWEVEAQHSPAGGSRLKFGLPLAPAKPKRRKTAPKTKAVLKA
jgi:hypothetical protein